MDKNSNSYVALFAVGICVVLSAALAFTFNVLQETIEANKQFDKQKNVLKAAKLYDPNMDADKGREALETLYSDRIEELVLVTDPKGSVNFQGNPMPLATGELMEGKLPTDIAALEKAESAKPEGERRGFLALYRVRDAEAADKTQSYVLRTRAYGLWSWLEGFLAVTPDFRTVVGITYFSHGETPGLGAEVDNPDWQKSWEGKQLFDEGQLVGITVKKGAVSQDVEEERKHYVDGLSGATITSQGVSNYTKDVLKTYQPYFSKN